MRHRSTLILLAIAVIAAAYFFLVEQPRHTRNIESIKSDNPITAAFPSAVDRIEISRPDIKISFDRNEGHWRMLTPIVDKAEDSSVNTLLYSIARAELESRIEANPANLADFGLDPAAADVTIEGKLERKGSRVRVIIGDFSLTKSHCYVRVDGSDDVFLAPAGLRRYATRPLFDFRNKRITEVPVGELSRILVTTADRSTDWHKDQSQKWFTVQYGDSIRGDSSAVEGMVRELRGLRAKNLLLEGRSEADNLFAESQGAVSMWFYGDTPPTVIEFGKRKNGRCYVSNSADGRVALVDTTVLRIFRRTVADLRNKRLLDFDTDRAARITLDTTDRSVTIVKNDSGWSFANPEFGMIDQTRADRLVNKLRSIDFLEVDAERLDNRDEYGLQRPAFEFTIFDDQDFPVDRMSVGHRLAGDRLVYVTSQSTGVLARIDGALIEHLADEFNSLGDR